MPRVRAVIDTNVAYSGLTHRGIPHEILEAGDTEEFIWIISDAILKEYVEIFTRKNILDLARPLLSWLKSNAIHVNVPDFLPDTFTEIADPDDRPIFAAAYVSRAIFVTGDRRHFPWSSYRSIRIMSPADFHDIL